MRRTRDPGRFPYDPGESMGAQVADLALIAFATVCGFCMIAALSTLYLTMVVLTSIVVGSVGLVLTVTHLMRAGTGDVQPDDGGPGE
ncbi:MAG: hypothetical protein JWN00_5433 [Actinomycetia bacterium]|nr:hypothetical protein [Actinomycetes bacterium]